MKTPLSLVFTTLLLFVLPTFAQFQFFEQMFNQGGQQQQQPRNAASDSSWYKQQYEAEVEDKVELDDGSMVCVSKGGYKAGEAARKIELARKGLL
ncbi:hypothetical protein E4T52_10319 [Aureobasidium sp. EXF-3400]|nr:hypothetical protein E4T51_11837 [Aureobasidium sp. EXF-12344]KAI4774705.1 hypothetical protein E4T52_10319 [Aureobasidium sp. EXF-3400]